jgi:hypothetical protein
MYIRSIILSAVLLFVSAPIYSQDWPAVSGLKPGTRIYLTAKNGSEFKGKFISASDDAVVINVKGRSASVARNDVLTIHLARRGSILKRAFIGAAAGAGLGVGVGAGIVAATRSDGLAAAAGFLYGIPIGAVVGAATTGHKRGRLIYSGS